MTCSIEGCDKTTVGRGWCRTHYNRWHRYGDPLRTPPSWSERFMAQMEPQPDGCIWFTGCIDKHGYGVTRKDNRQWRAHRAAYELLVGPIPDGLILDHTCHNGTDCLGGLECMHRRCVNPNHLRVTTNAENLRASHLTLNGVNARKTHCIHGHEFTPENTIINRHGTRACRECQRGHWREYQRQLRLLEAVGL